jgi:hypothetical protein
VIPPLYHVRRGWRRSKGSLVLVRENRLAADVIIKPAEDTSERRAFYDKIDKKI